MIVGIFSVVLQRLIGEKSIFDLRVEFSVPCRIRKTIYRLSNVAANTLIYKRDKILDWLKLFDTQRQQAEPSWK